jgi:hypothetical protein
MNEPTEHRALQALEDAAKNEDADGIDLALRIDFEGLTPAFVPVLIQLLGASWHQRHQDIAHTLQGLKDPRAVDALYQATFVRYHYLAYDEYFGLARKCTWALADTGTPEAKAKLKLLAAGENPVIAGYAQKRLDKWDDEQKRKRAS